MDELVENMNALNVDVKPHIEEHPVFKLLPPDMVDKVLAERFKKDVEYMRKGAENTRNQRLQEIRDEEMELMDNPIYQERWDDEMVEMNEQLTEQRREVVRIYERKAVLYNRMLQPLNQMGY